MRAFWFLLILPLVAPLPGQPDAASSLLDAVGQSPALAAARQRVAAAERRIDASGRLADPQVEGMGSRMVGPMNERSTMWGVNVTQPLPKRGERAADRQRAQAAAAMAAADYAVMAGEMAADVALALAEAESAQARIALLEAQLNRLEGVRRAVETRLAAGGGQLADRLTVETRIAAMQLAIEDERRMQADAWAEARGRLGLAPEAPLPAYAAPNVDEISLDESPALELARARVAEALAMVKMAQAAKRPMTAVGLRFEQERMRMGDENTLGIAFMSEIPWRSRRYARAELEAAQAERGAAETDANAARFRINAALTRVARAEQLADTARRLSAGTLGRLEAEYDALLRAAGVGGAGGSTVLQTVELLEQATDTELQVIQADTAARTARAELWRYVPASRFSFTQS